MAFGTQPCGSRFDAPIHRTNETPQPIQYSEEPALNEMLSEPAARSPEEIITRKTMALARLAHIEKMTSSSGNPLNALTERFQCTPAICSFDLNTLLEKYQTNEPASKLCDFMDWACVPQDEHRIHFKEAIAKYDIELPFNEECTKHYTAVKDLFKNFVAYFDQQFRSIGSEEAEEALKGQFRQVYDSILDAHNNSIDQVLSQMQTLVLNVLAEGATSQENTSQRKLTAQAGLALCKYRINLLKEILTRENPNERHMSDLERVVTQRVAEAFGLRGNIFRTGTPYESLLPNINAQVQNTISIFFDAYKPENYLLTELRTNMGTENTRLLRNEMMIWAIQYYDWNSEDSDVEAQPHDMDCRISENFNELSVTLGGNLTHAATALLMEKLGFIAEISKGIGEPAF